MRNIITGLLLSLMSTVGWGEEDVYTQRTATIEVEGAYWSVWAPKTLYCRFPTRQWTRDKVASSQDIPADEYDGIAFVKVGKENTILKNDNFTYELETIHASQLSVSAIKIGWAEVKHFQYDAREGHALWTSSGSTTVTTFIGSCTEFEE